MCTCTFAVPTHWDTSVAEQAEDTQDSSRHSLLQCCELYVHSPNQIAAAWGRGFLVCVWGVGGGGGMAKI